MGEDDKREHAHCSTATTPWSGWAIASLVLALSTIPVFIAAAAGPANSPAAFVFLVLLVATFVFAAVTAARVDWDHRRGKSLVAAAALIGLAWLVLAVATYEVTYTD